MAIRKSILNKTRIEATYFTDDNLPCYGLNIYDGCYHNCKYCYARRLWAMRNKDGSREYADAEPVENAVELLTKEVKKKQPGVVMLSATTDPYQPLNRSVGLTTAVLPILLDNGFQVIVQTKSPDVLMDFPLLMHRQDQVRVGITIVTVSELVRKKWEPNAPPLMTRYVAVKKLHELGIKTQVSVEPLLPGTPKHHLDDLISSLDNYTDRWVFGKLNYAGKGWDEYYIQVREYVTKRLGEKAYFKREQAAFPGG